MKLAKVSIIIPVRDEEVYINQCLRSLMEQDFPKESLEILVIDGMSIDQTMEIVNEFCQKHSYIRLLNNPQRTIPTALNIGIREANGDFILRIDAHAKYAPDYVRRCIELLESSDAANVGGCARAIGNSYKSQAIALAMSCSFGVGNATFRYYEKEMWVDTVWPGAWRRVTLKKLDGFKEDCLFDEDYELNYRLRKSGGKILLSPQIRVEYFVRSSFSSLMKQYFRYGFFKVKTLVEHPEALVYRHLVPTILVLALLFSALVFPFNRLMSTLVPGLYIIVNLASSTKIVIRRGFRCLPILPLCFAIMHIAYGIGFLCGLMRFGIPKFGLSSLVYLFSRKRYTGIKQRM